MISIPRDTFVGKNKSRAKAYDKINAIYSNDGPEKTLEYVNNMTGMDIHYYAVIHNQVVVELVNDIGGVYFDVPINMKYDDKTQNLHINLKAGYQKLDGDHAEQLLRFRHNNNGTTYPSEYGDNDYGRMKTQREFTIEVLKQAMKLSNITHIKSIMTTLYQNVETNLALDDIFPYVPWAVNFDTNNIVNNQISGASEKCNNLWFFVYNKEKTEEIISETTNYLNGADLIEEIDEEEIQDEDVSNEIIE